MKINTASLCFVLSVAYQQQSAFAATCGDGQRGDGICPQSSYCCSEWGWCGSGPLYCPSDPQPTSTPVVPQPTTASPLPPTVPTSNTDDTRMIAYLGNWHSCPTAAQLAQYTHIVVAFAVSYTWAPGKNSCSPTCEIATPPICNNNANPDLLAELKAQGKQIIVSFGGAGMGGSWAGDQNDCWEYCYGRETQVVNRLTEIVNELDADGIDIDYEYFYEDYQNGSGFSKGAEAQNFLSQITVGLRNSLPSNAIVTHAPMDVDLEPHTAYFQLLKEISHTLDFIMPQYYNGVTRPILDGVDGSGNGALSALSHYNILVNEFFGGDATRMVFGFCIDDCSATNSNASGDQAAQVMIDLASSFSCHGGAFFWVAEDDREGSWSSVVNQAMTVTTACGSTTNAPVTVISGAPTMAPTLAPTSAPTKVTIATPAPTDPPTPAPTEAVVVTGSPTKNPTAAPTKNPTKAPTDNNGSDEPCCPPGYSGLLAFDECLQHYHCSDGQVIGNIPTYCPAGTLFDNNMQLCNWAMQVSCLGNAIC